MKAEDIKRGHFYRFRDSNLILLMLFEWSTADTKQRELEYVALDHGLVAANETRRDTASALASRCSCEVVPAWVNVTPAAEPDARQTEIAEATAALPSWLTELGND